MKRRASISALIVSAVVCCLLAAMLSACSPDGEDPNPPADDPPSTSTNANSNIESGGPGVGIDPNGSIFTNDQVSEARSELAMIRQCLIGSENICAVAMMGYATRELSDFLKEEAVGYFPVVAAVSPGCWVQSEGDEVYLIVPRDPNASVAVNEWLMSPTSSTGPYEGEVGKVLYRSDAGDPVIVRGNISEVSPNLQICIVEEGGDSIAYIPFCSLMDGTLDVPPGSPSILDFTSYPDFRVSPDEVAGDWSTRWGYLENGEEVACALTIQEDGYLSYAWGPSDEVYQNYYEGGWYASPQAGEGSVPEEAVVFDLKLTEGEEGVPGEIVGTFVLSHYSDLPDYLYIDHLDGAPLIYSQLSDGTLEFNATVG